MRRGGLLFPYFAAAAGALSRKIICENSVRPPARPATFKMTHELLPGIFFIVRTSVRKLASFSEIRSCLHPWPARRKKKGQGGGTENRRNANFMFFVNLGMQEDRARGDKKKAQL